MYNFPIGFICGLKTAQLDLAAELKLNGVQLYMPVNGKAPRDMKGAKLAESRAMLSDRNLVVSALCGDMGAYDNPETNPGRVDEFKRIVDIAADFDTKVVTTHIGKVPSDRNNPTYDCMLKACDEIGTYAYRAGVRFAVETGPETAKVLCGFLDELDNPGAGVNLRPGQSGNVLAGRPGSGGVYPQKVYSAYPRQGWPQHNPAHRDRASDVYRIAAGRGRRGLPGVLEGAG